MFRSKFVTYKGFHTHIFGINTAKGGGVRTPKTPDLTTPLDGRIEHSMSVEEMTMLIIVWYLYKKNGKICGGPINIGQKLNASKVTSTYMEI